MTDSSIVQAAENADWQQVVLNGGPPCFALMDDRFCLRAARWEGHNSDHVFIPLSALISGMARACREWQERANLSLDARDEAERLRDIHAATLEMTERLRQSADRELAALQSTIDRAPIAKIGVVDSGDEYGGFVLHPITIQGDAAVDEMLGKGVHLVPVNWLMNGAPRFTLEEEAE